MSLYLFRQKVPVLGLYNPTFYTIVVNCLYKLSGYFKLLELGTMQTG